MSHAVRAVPCTRLPVRAVALLQCQTMSNHDSGPYYIEAINIKFTADNLSFLQKISNLFFSVVILNDSCQKLT